MSNASQLHNPLPSPARAVYGFVLYAASAVAFGRVVVFAEKHSCSTFCSDDIYTIFMIACRSVLGLGVLPKCLVEGDWY